MKRKSRSKPFTEMNMEELAEATAEFDQELIIDSFGPPPPEALERLERARKRGRPRRNEGVKVISVSMEKGLLARATALARKRKMSRSALIEVGLMTVLARADEEASAKPPRRARGQKRKAV